MSQTKAELAFHALDTLSIELPSWGFADTGTRFGKFYEPGAARTIEEKLQDGGHVHRLTGACPSVAVHVAWDFPQGVQSVPAVAAVAEGEGVRIGSVNPTLFEDQSYKFGSLANLDEAVRKKAIGHVRDSVDILNAVGGRDLVLWLADGSNYPGATDIRRRKHLLQDGLHEIHTWLTGQQRLLVEYKPFEPAFYHTDIADWGMALLLARSAGPRARVLVDTGHHFPGQNIEQIVTWLLDENMLGGFHFNDKKYADDDLTAGSIDPYQLFRILVEIHSWAFETGSFPDIAFMVDQSHNIKPKIEATIQTVTTIQELYVKSALVDFERLYECRRKHRVIDAESVLRSAFFSDVQPLVEDWRRRGGLPADPLQAHRESGYAERVARERGCQGGGPSRYAGV
ncbi:MAG TPA: TIM barrel protein [Acidobacteriota bacterium]|nr:TIM barrel protein [Acidobacteriota bacterium]